MQLERSHWVSHFVEHIIDVAKPGEGVKDFEQARRDNAPAPIRVFPGIHSGRKVTLRPVVSVRSKEHDEQASK
jgi:methionine synthase II (cobalamin-independent)